MNDLPQQRQAVVAVIQRDDQRFLVVRRAPGVVKPGKLCFPGGMIESGESEEEALQRELREELSAPRRAEKSDLAQCDAVGCQGRLVADRIAPWGFVAARPG